MSAQIHGALRILLLGLLALLALPATAHELSMADMQLSETAPGQFVMLWSSSEKGQPGDELKPVWPIGCNAEENRVNCGETGLAGTMKIKGIGKSFSAVMVKISWLDGQSHVYAFTPGKPSARLRGAADDGANSGAWAYLNLGIEHILLGVDHLLFVLGLLLIVSNRWMLLKTVTSFTLAHSITLAVATLGVAHVSAAPLNAAIALSILFLGPEIVRRWRGETSFTIRHPWVVAFAFGLLHGFGFASGLAQLGLPKEEIPLALLMFNVGVEVGQLAFVAAILLLLRSIRLLRVQSTLLLERFPGYLVGTLGAFWTIQRVDIFFRSVS
jgi:hydrogenase/urease accessory protein HupE